MDQNFSLWYFAYGSNMDPEQMIERGVICQTSRKGALRDYKLAFNLNSQRWNGGVADIIPCSKSTVEGVLYLVTENGLETLDHFEGVSLGVYQRRAVMVETVDGMIMEAMCYEVVHKSSEFIPPSSAYVERLIKGAVAHGLSPKYLAKLKTVFRAL